MDGEPLERDQVYRVVTNNFLAGGQDGWVTFAEGTNRWDTYYDMQVALNEYIEMPRWDRRQGIDGRIIRLDKVVTILHTNDTHGIWPETYYYGTPEGWSSWLRTSRRSGPRTPTPSCSMPAIPSRAMPLPSTSATPPPTPSPAA